MKTQNGNDLWFFSTDDREVFVKCESEFPRLFPEYDFVFVRTFDDWSKWRSGRKGELLPTSRLLWRWVLMNENTERKIKPHFKKHRKRKKPLIIIALGFGRDVYQYAVMWVYCRETLGFQKVLVEVRVIEQGVRPPLYLLIRPKKRSAIRADNRYFADKRQRRHYFESRTQKGRFGEFVAIIRKETGALLAA